MIRICFFSICLLVFSGVSTTFAQESETTWEGTLDARGQELRLRIDLVDANGKSVTGEMRSLDQGNTTLPLAEIQVDKTTFRFSIPTLNATFRGKLRKQGTIAAGTFAQNGIELPLTLRQTQADRSAGKKETSEETLKEAWIGELNMGLMKPVMQFRIVETENGETAAYFDSITEGRTGFKATWSLEGDTLKFDVAKIKLAYRGELNEARDSADGIWSQGGRDVPLTLKWHANVYDSKNVWENRPQRPAGPFNYHAKQVKFENSLDDVTLAGTLTIPKKVGRHPVVVLISGSGPQDRDESIMEHKPFLVLADYLSSRGIAVLRYDDRGTGQSTGNFGTATTEDFARDAAAAVEFLKHDMQINPEEIGLAGHSEGGLIAPMVVGLRDDVGFVVLLAATGVDGIAINESQTEALLRAEGTSEAEIEISKVINRAVIEASLHASEANFSALVEPTIQKVLMSLPESEREKAEENLRLGINNSKRRLRSPWMQFFLSYDPRPALKNMDCPVLAIVGSKDLQVLPDLNMPEIEKSLSEGGNSDYEIVVMKGLNHLFQQCETGSMSEYVTIEETFNPVALKRVGDWITKRTHVVE